MNSIEILCDNIYLLYNVKYMLYNENKILYNALYNNIWLYNDCLVM